MQRILQPFEVLHPSHLLLRLVGLPVSGELVGGIPTPEGFLATFFRPIGGVSIVDKYPLLASTSGALLSIT